MGARTDAALALLVLVAVGTAFVIVEPGISWVAASIGGLGTLGFELAAARDPDSVRRYWERPLIQRGSVILALAGIAVGAVVAPSSVLSFAFGALVTYLVVLLVVQRSANGESSVSME
ncbi:hypothetical protein [Natronorubrum bangense]|uniref:Uncharacterized protein n=2 Tax=Natronorubrum bangense TaxID=61858 RepID=L9WGB9_9EURY|nr:hypothetical protein [Natronorubrum bangense]ELY48520.1 hypothetical protein C494_10915 [Natronorubrum bangense JCM 10635]QCC53806.1 hypothetical protein DV706_04460 [Natronorubrum bangense]